MKYIFIENEKISGCGEALRLDENVLNIEVSENIYNDICSDSLKYIYSDGKIIPNPNYDSDNQYRLNQKRIQDILFELDNIDKKRIRAICEDEPKNERTGETWLDFYNSQVYELREELKSLGYEE